MRPCPWQGGGGPWAEVGEERGPLGGGELPVPGVCKQRLDPREPRLGRLSSQDFGERLYMNFSIETLSYETPFEMFCDINIFQKAT